MAACLVLLFSGCGGSGDGAPANQPARVTYSEKVADGTVANYTDAHWLFQNYLGDYGVPEQLKPQFFPALQLLANGFDLQVKTGQDVKSNIKQVHAMFQQHLASGEGTQFFAQLQAQVQSGEPVNVTGLEQEAPDTAHFIEPVISSEDRVAIEDAKRRDEEERAEIERIVQTHQLPYRIDGMTEQWFIFSPAMKGGGKGGRAPSGQPASSGHSDLRTWGWRPGDMVWANGSNSIPGVPGHNAIVWGNGEQVLLIDANTDVGVSLAADIQKWANRYSELRAISPRLNWSQGEYNCFLMYGTAFECRPDSWQRLNAWWYADARRGLNYNWNFLNPRNTDRFYCSSLLWNAYDSVGFNVIRPWVLGAFGMITPNQIRDSAVVTTFKVSRL